MKILVLLSDLHDTLGGIQSFNRSLVSALRELSRSHGWTLQILVLNDSRPAPTIETFAGSRVRFMWAALRASHTADRVLFGHIHFSALSMGMPDVEKWLIIHGIEAWNPLPRTKRLGLLKMDHVLAVSEFTKDRFVDFHGFDPRRCDVFPNTLLPLPSRGGNPPPQSSPIRGEEAVRNYRRRLGLPDGKMILTVSRLETSERYKCIDRMILAMPAIVKRDPRAFYVLVGQGTDLARLKALAAQVHMQDRIYFAQRVSPDELPLYYQSCDLFVLPSLEEGFGIVFLEAMAQAKACIGAKAGGVPEVIEDQVTGRLVDPRVPGSLEKQVMELLAHPARRRHMGTAGRERFEKNFSYPHFKRRLGHLLRSRTHQSPERSLAA